MRFTTPLALLLLMAAPWLIWLARPRRGASRWREWVSLALRLLIIALIVFGLAGTQVVRAADELAVVFLVDASDSIGPEQAQKAETFVRQSIKQMSANDQAAVIVFGANALVERPMSGLAELAPITSVPQTLHSDIAEAIRLGLALFPAGNARRLVLISDGMATLGNVAGAARLAAAAGIPVDIVPLSRAIEDEVILARVDAPARVSEGERFAIDITAESTADTPAQVRILSSGNVVYQDEIQLRPGVNNFSVMLQSTAQEFARYVVQVVPATDTYYQNNSLAAFTEIVGPPRVLLVAAEGPVEGVQPETIRPEPVRPEWQQLALALEATGLLVDRVIPARVPASLSGLSNYASVILVNVNAKDLAQRQMAALQSYVRDLGGGLVTVGGPESYGMGGYYRTPLEETLPVDMQIKDQERFPAVAMAIVIDRSGSMAMEEGGLAKIQLAAEGAVRVVELLNDFDEITVIPVDTAPDNPIGPASAADRANIIAQIREIGAGGGGIYVRTGLEAAAEALAQSENQIKHIIVLADGADSEQKEGVPELIETLTDGGVTISMVSIGDGPDVPWLQQMADLGGGRFHFTDRAANLPQIFTQETTAIQRSYLVEERFFPSLGDTGFARNHPIFRTMERSGITRVPPLYGYVGTSPKDTAQTILKTPMGDPLLAAWEYGLGRAVAWTSDASGRWGVDWVRWGGFPTFWSTVTRWTISQQLDGNVETAVSYEEELARLTIEARSGEGGFLNNLAIEANVIDPTGEVTLVELEQVAPGRYEGQFWPASEGAYFIRLAGTDGDGQDVIAQTSGWVLGYSPEYRQLDADRALLSTIAEITGGRELDIPDINESIGLVFEHNLPGSATIRPIWPWLIGLAVFLLPLDIAVRRLVITSGDVRRAWEATFGRLLPESTPVPERSEQVERLIRAKERVSPARSAEGDRKIPTPTMDEGRVRVAEDTLPEPVKGQQEEVHPDAGDMSVLPPEEGADDSTLAARLLQKRRRRE